MGILSPENLWHMDEESLIAIFNTNRLNRNHRRVYFYAPSFTYYKTSRFCSSPDLFPTVSITGKSCALNCKHCGGKVLETMHPSLTPKKLIETCRELKEKGALGCLISGGCMPDGSVPLKPFLSTIRRIKEELGLTLMVHTGIIDSETARGLKKARVDLALIDVIGSDETIKEICDLDFTVKNIEHSLDLIQKAGVNFVPHIVAGLHNGKLKGELRALKIISRYKPSAVVVIAFMPLHGTPMAGVEPPKPINIARTIATAKLIQPNTPLVLGCVRPKGKHRANTDILSLKAGVDGIAFPTQAAIEFTENRGYELFFSPFCCAHICLDIKKKGKSTKL